MLVLSGQRQASLRTRLLLLVLVPVVPMTVLFLWVAARERDQAVTQTREYAASLATLVSAHVGGLIESGRQAVVAISQLPQVRQPDAPACSATLASVQRFFPTYTIIGVAQPNGQVTCSSAPRAGLVSTADRDWFRDAVETRDFTVGEFQVGRITGQPAVNVAYPMLQPDSSVAGVVYAAIPVSTIAERLAEVRLPPGGSVVLLDYTGTVVARQPDHERWVGQRYPEGAVLDAVRRGDAMMTGRGIDGIEREFAREVVRAAPGGATQVLVGLPTARLVADSNRVLALSLAALGATAAAAMMLAWFVSERLVQHPVQSLIRTARRLQGGELDARSNPREAVSELRSLGRALDAMAETLAGQIRRTELILASAGEGICGLDRTGRITFVNPAALVLLGRPREEVVGQSLHTLVHREPSSGEAHPADDCPLAQALLPGAHRVAGEDLFWCADGTAVPVAYTGAPLRSGIADDGAVFIVVDSTERKRAEQDRADLVAREEVARAKDEIMGVVSHELRTPLAALLGFTELLLTHEYPAEMRRQFLETMLLEGKRLTGLINDFLDLQRLESGKARVAPRPTALLPLLDRAVASAGPDAERPIVLAIPSDLPLVAADPDRMQQVLANLFSNARKYSPSGGEIVAAAQLKEGFVEVTVTDRGLGIPPEALPHLFETFYRVDNSDRRDIKGTGLGLAIVKNIVEAHGGSVHVASAGVGQGSTFTVTLPIAHSVPPPPSGSGLPAPRPTTLPARVMADVLVIEDDQAFSSWLAELLRGEGHTVRLAASGEEGLRAIDEARPGVVLLDVRLHDHFSGLDLLAVLRARPDTRDLPVVIISVADDRDRAVALGVEDYLLKPITRDQLLDIFGRLPRDLDGDVLVVEDDPSTQLLVVQQLEKVGLASRAVATGEEALEILRLERHRFSLVVLDLGLPGMDGFAVLEALSSAPETRDLPVVIFSARDLTEEEQRTLLPRAHAIVRKGNGAPVQDAVARVLGRQSAASRH